MNDRSRRVSLFGLALSSGLWFVLVALPLALAVALVATLAQGGVGTRQLAASAALTDSWRVAEPALLAPDGDGSSRAAAALALDRAFERAGDERATPFAATVLRWLPPVAIVVASLCFALLVRGLLRERAAGRSLDDGRNRRQQAAILKLLDEMSPLADGDLTVRATVDESMTGALADAFNRAVSELRRLVTSVDGAADNVGRAVADTRTTAHALGTAASVQSRELLRASNYLNAMSGATAELSMNAATSAHKASAVQAAVGEGRQALLDAGAELDRIRDESSLTMRLTHRLADNVRAIDAEVETVRAIATRSELLSLNTTVRAAAVTQRAVGSSLEPVADGDTRTMSDYGRLADDVSDLAAVLGRASREIASLTSVIRDDADETLRAMRETDAALSAGIDGTAALYRHLTTIERATGGLDRLIGDTAARAARQAEVVRRLSDNMAVLNRLGRDGADGLHAVGRSLDELQALADGLQAGVADFRLEGRTRKPRHAPAAELAG